jgi:hypothetical protein
VLLEAPNINNVILYFQSLYGENSQFELRGINIEEVQANGDQNSNNNIRNSAVSGNASEESESTDVSSLCKQCCAISLYSICYSVIKHAITGIQIQWPLLFTLALLCITTLG